MAIESRAPLDRVLQLPERLTRSSDDRVIAGVCGGLGAGLGVDPTVVRLALVVLTLANGAGLLAYLAALVLLPSQPESTTHEAARPPTAERAAGVGLITFGALLAFGHLGLLLPAELVWSSALAAVGFALVWTRTDEANRTRGLFMRSVGGGLLVVAGLGGLFAAGGVLSRIGQLGLAVLATSVGVAVLLGPWIMRLVRDLATERRQRIRSEERSEMAAHLHDSVLQTLALIQRADGPGRAKTLARRQERELRAWLFDERPPDGEDGSPDHRGRAGRRALHQHSAVSEPTSRDGRRPSAHTLSAALERMVTDVEDRHDVEVDLVLVGSCPMEPRLEALVAALREAASNAARHAAVDEVSVYVEVQHDRVEAYVRDRGKGFDLDAVEASRLGVRESIVGRMARHGGKAEVHTAPGDGTEVTLEIARRPDSEDGA